MKKSLILAGLALLALSLPIATMAITPQETNPQLAALLKNKARTVIVQKKLVTFLNQAQAAKLACEKYADLNGGCITGVCDKTHKTNVNGAQKQLKPKCDSAKTIKKQVNALSAEFKSAAYKKNLTKLVNNLGWLNRYITANGARLSDVTNNVDDFEVALESLLEDANVSLTLKTASLKDRSAELQTILDKVTTIKESCKIVGENNECSYIYCSDAAKKEAQLKTRTELTPGCQENVTARKQLIALILKIDDRDDRALLLKINQQLFNLDSFMLVQKIPYEYKKSYFDDTSVLIEQLQTAAAQ